MMSSTPPQSGRSVAVAIFGGAAQARRAVQALTKLGIPERDVALVSADSSTTDIQRQLGDGGVPEGEARFYAQEVRAGRVLLIVPATDNYEEVREMLVQHAGSDVESRGGALARAEGAGIPGGSGPKPIDVSGRWEDVASRYEMLWQQHYGTTDATWEQMQPTYQFAWEVANQPRLRGRPWAEVESTVREEWTRTHDAQSWDSVADPIRDVWEDVAAEAATFAEGGQDRSIPARA